jgi:hypothetical protein
MGKLTFVWLGLYFGGLLGGLIHPIYPMVSYLVYYFAPPQFHWWGRRIPDLRFSLTASAVVWLSMFLNQHRLEEVKSERNSALPWYACYAMNSTVVTTWAVDRAVSWVYSVIVWKLLVLYLMIPAVVRTPAYFDVFARTMVIGGTWWGYKAWEKPDRSGGRLAIIIGGPDSKTDNGAAGVLLTVIPFAALYTLTERRLIRKLAAAACTAFIVNVFILCNSRGATLGLIASGIAALLLASRRRRLRLLGTVSGGVLAVLLLADPEFIERQQTTANPTDGSAQSRLELWAAGLTMIKDYPLGAGGYGYHLLSATYASEVVAATDSEARSSHNTYIQIAVEWGVHGALIFLCFIAGTVWILHVIRRRAPANTWYHDRSLALEAGLVGILTAAFFSNHVYTEAIVWLCSLSFSLYRLQSTELARETSRAPAAQASVPGFALAVRSTDAANA